MSAHADQLTPSPSLASTPDTSVDDETPVKRPVAPARPRLSPVLTPDEDEGAEEWARYSREELVTRLKRKNDQTTQLAEKVEQTQRSLDELSDKRDALSRDLEWLESRNREGLADQARIEEDLASRIDISDKLRSQLREVERGKREIEKRYREQSASFDADRQSWQDSERHLQSRISSLSKVAHEARQSTLITPATPESAPDRADEDVSEESEDALAPLAVVRSKSPATNARRSLSPTPPPNGAIAEALAEVKELQEQYEALLTSYDSLNKSHEVLQEETSELKRINHALMQTQENYEVLLCERTLTGELLGQGVLGQLGGGSAATSPTTSPARETALYETSGSGSIASGAVAAFPSRAKRRKQPEPTMGGMDLAAELDRANETEAEMAEREAEEDRQRNQQRSGAAISEDVEDLQTEVTKLRKANEALSIYVSRILEKIQASDAFESILAKQSEYARSPKSSDESARSPRVSEASRRSRPMSIHYVASPVLSTKRHSTDISSMGVVSNTPVPPSSANFATSPPLLAVKQDRPLPAAPTSTDKQQKRMSITQYATSLFSTSAAKENRSPEPPKGFKPMLLGTNAAMTGPAPAAPTGTRNLDNEMDEEDLRERERLQAELKLWGAEVPPVTSKRMSYASPSLLARSPPASGNVWSVDSSPATAIPLSRSSSRAGPTPPPKDPLEAAQQRDKEQRAALEAGRASGFTELRNDRRRPSSQLSRHTSDSSAGLGISVEDKQASAAPATTPSPTSETPSGTSWTKATKRMSTLFGGST